MVNDFIDSIEFSTNNHDIISLSSEYFTNFYIANIDDNGDEIAYGIKNNSLVANYFMIKVINDKSKEAKKIIDRLNDKKDIISITVYFKNGNQQLFDISKKRVRENDVLINKYQEVFIDEDDLCILITDKNIKYKKELFA